MVSAFFRQLGHCFESIAELWIANKKLSVLHLSVLQFFGAFGHFTIV